jgi:hypothetical protein
LFNILLKKIKNKTCWANLGAIYSNGPSVLLDINLQEDNVEYVMPYIVTREKKKNTIVSMIEVFFSKRIFVYNLYCSFLSTIFID